MPFKSAKQRGWMFRYHPKLARKWARKYGYNVGGGKRKKKPKKRKQR